MSNTNQERSIANDNHWGENIAYPVSDWQELVANDETRLGYWEWVESEEQRLDEEEADNREDQ